MKKPSQDILLAILLVIIGVALANLLPVVFRGIGAAFYVGALVFLIIAIVQAVKRSRVKKISDPKKLI